MSLTGTDYKPDTRVFFGGSFLPPHIGHDSVLQRLCSEHEVSHVHVVPTGTNPLKKNDHGFSSKEKEILVDSWLADFRLRHRVLAQKIVLETFELEADKPSYTVNSIERLSKAHSQRWVLAMGADLLEDLTKWKSIHELLSL